MLVFGFLRFPSLHTTQNKYLNSWHFHNRITSEDSNPTDHQLTMPNQVGVADQQSFVGFQLAVWSRWLAEMVLFEVLEIDLR